MDFRCNIRFLNKHNTKSDTFKMHSHDCYEFVYFLTGNGKTIIDGKSHAVSAHSYCIIAPHTEHIECIDSYGEILFIGFDYASSSVALQGGVYHGCEKENLALIHDIFEEYKTQNFGYTVASEALLALLLLAIIRSNTGSPSKSKDLYYIKAYIEQHSEQKINFAELATLCGYSSSYFRHIFKERFGISPQEYMINIRIDKARQLLQTTNRSCTEIAYDCGFSNSAQMSAMVKRKYGKSPTKIKADLYKNKSDL